LETKAEADLTYSALVLIEEEAPDFAEYVRSLYEAFEETGKPFEIVLIGNGTEGFLKNTLHKMQPLNSKLKGFALDKKASQAVCLKAALKETSGDVIVVCGSYQQLSRGSFLSLLEGLDESADIICPWRRRRVDRFFDQIQSRAFNWLVRKAAGSRLNDLSCTVRVFRRRVLDETPLYGRMYRFLPILAQQRGFKTKEVQCDHVEERGKGGFYSISEYAERLIDIVTLYFSNRFSRKPLRFFSAIGMAFLAAGLIMSGYAFAERFLFGHLIGDRPILLLGILFMVLGVQAASVGLLAEIIAFTHGRRTPEYTVEKIL
jgi:hypothetical protein